jgi:hypothetical protein
MFLKCIFISGQSNRSTMRSKREFSDDGDSDENQPSPSSPSTSRSQTPFTRSQTPFSHSPSPFRRYSSTPTQSPKKLQSFSEDEDEEANFQSIIDDDDENPSDANGALNDIGNFEDQLDQTEVDKFQQERFKPAANHHGPEVEELQRGFVANDEQQGGVVVNDQQEVVVDVQQLGVVVNNQQLGIVEGMQQGAVEDMQQGVQHVVDHDQDQPDHDQPDHDQPDHDQPDQIHAQGGHQVPHDQQVENIKIDYRANPRVSPRKNKGKTPKRFDDYVLY